MRNEKKKRKAKNERKEGNEKRKQRERKTVRREERKEKEKKEKGKGKIFRLSGGRSSTVRGLKLVHAAHSTCGHQKVGVSTTSTR